jgi:hypothetical protein
MYLCSSALRHSCRASVHRLGQECWETSHSGSKQQSVTCMRDALPCLAHMQAEAAASTGSASPIRGTHSGSGSAGPLPPIPPLACIWPRKRVAVTSEETVATQISRVPKAAHTKSLIGEEPYLRESLICCRRHALLLM